MLERLINVSLTQRLLVCFAGLVLMCSGFYAVRHVVC
jgi:Cu/Ag efflux pump CusA